MEINAWSLLSFLRGNVLFENAGNLFFFRRRSEEYGYIFSSKSESRDLRTPLLLKLNGEDFFEIAKVESEISRSSKFLLILSNS